MSNSENSSLQLIQNLSVSVYLTPIIFRLVVDY